MRTMTHHTERAECSSGRARVALQAVTAARFVNPLATTSNVSGVWYEASPVALRHDITKAGSPRGSS